MFHHNTCSLLKTSCSIANLSVGKRKRNAVHKTAVKQRTGLLTSLPQQDEKCGVGVSAFASPKMQFNLCGFIANTENAKLYLKFLYELHGLLTKQAAAN